MEQLTYYHRSGVVQSTTLTCKEIGILYRIADNVKRTFGLPSKLHANAIFGHYVLIIWQRRLTKQQLQNIVNEELNPDCITIVKRKD